ncbi:MAG TPA: cyclase family protein [Actinobacteria bacterium]|nr:cyclase family protein [Actinomycetota bacterium]
MARIIDISVPLYTGMVSYPGDTKPEIIPNKGISAGGTANLSELRLGSHSGTHVDAPHHFLDSEETVDKLPLTALMGPARVLDLTGVEGAVTKGDLESAGMAGAERILLKTSNSSLWGSAEFTRTFVAMDDESADYAVGQGVLLIAIDYLSIERFHSDTHHVHLTLLGAGVIIIEGVNLHDVEAGDYELVCLPIKIRGGDGAPARAVLIER